MTTQDQIQADHNKMMEIIADNGILLEYLQRLTMYYYMGKLEQICKGVDKDDVFERTNALLLSRKADIGLCDACECLGDPDRLNTMVNGDRVCNKCMAEADKRGE